MWKYGVDCVFKRLKHLEKVCFVINLDCRAGETNGRIRETTSRVHNLAEVSGKLVSGPLHYFGKYAFVRTLIA